MKFKTATVIFVIFISLVASIFLMDNVKASGVIANSSISIDMQPINNNTLILTRVNASTINISGNDASFMKIWTNGTVREGPFMLDNNVRNTSRIAVDVLNATHAIFAWMNYPLLDELRAIYSMNGTALLGATTVDGANVIFWDTCVAHLANRSIIGWVDSAEGDFDAYWVGDNSTAAVLIAEVQIDAEMIPTTNWTDEADCHAINATSAVFAWVNYTGADTIMISRWNANGVQIGANTKVDNNVGTTGSVAVTTMDTNKFAVAWYDGTDQDVSMMMNWSNGTSLLVQTDINTTAGSGNKIDIGTISNKSGSGVGEDNIVVVWYGQASGDIMGATFDARGQRLANDFVIESNPNTTAMFSEISVVGKNPTSNFSLCPDTFAVAYTNTTGATVLKTYFTNGSVWDGNGCAWRAGVVANSCTYTSGHWNVNCADNCVITSNVALAGNAVIIKGTGTFTTEANITQYKNVTIRGTDASNKCRVRCLKGGCFKH